MAQIEKSNAIYLSIADGKICRRFAQPTAKSVTRTTQAGKTVHEEHYRGWSGVITSVKTRDTDYGKEWNVTIKDGDEIAILSFKYSSGYAASFLKALPNVDLSQPVAIQPVSNEVDGKKRTAIFINQNGVAIKWAYTKENPNGCPSLEKIKIKGVEQWDDSKMMEFLETKTAALFQISENDEPPF